MPLRDTLNEVPKWFWLMVGLAAGLVVVAAGYSYRGELSSLFKRGKTTSQQTPEVTIPTIINGELVLPRAATTSGTASSRGKNARLGVASANLVGVYDTQANPPKLSAIRILGEMENGGDEVVGGISPLVRFFDKNGKLVGQKIGRITFGFSFFDLSPTDKSVYDVSVDEPPAEAERLEISLNVASASDAAIFDKLKIASSAMEVKLADYPSGSESASQKVEYYTVAGSLKNQLSDAVTEITVYGWVKNKEGKVFGFSRVDFKNSLLSSGDTLDFKMIILPLALGQKMDSYEVSGWGKRYRLNL